MKAVRYLPPIALATMIVSAWPVHGEANEMPSQPGEYGVIEFSAKSGHASDYVNMDHIPELFDTVARVDGPIKQNIDRIIAEFCGDALAFEDGECGVMERPNSKNTVLISYSRGGWFAAYGVYRSYLTWTRPGSGRFTEPVLELEFDVDSDCDNNACEVRISLTGMRELSAQPLPKLNEPASQFKGGRGA